MNDQNKKQKQNKKLPAFYIALCCCVLAIGAAGYVSDHLRSAAPDLNTAELITPAPIKLDITEPEPLQAAEESVFNNETISEPLSIADFIPTEPPVTEDIEEIEAVSAPADVTDGFIMPLSGDILHQYSTEPSYNEIMRDWRTHNGIDIAAAEGDEIYCAADGEVTSCRSTVYGTEVTVSHSGGYETIYSQLAPGDDITPGRAVTCGETLGVVCASTGETVTEPHIHFEIKKDGGYIDPSSVIGA